MGKTRVGKNRCMTRRLMNNIGGGEEVRFSMGPLGISIRRIHGDKELTMAVDSKKLEVMRKQLVDEYLGELLWNMAVTLRGTQ